MYQLIRNSNNHRGPSKAKLDQGFIQPKIAQLKLINQVELKDIHSIHNQEDRHIDFTHPVKPEYLSLVKTDPLKSIAPELVFCDSAEFNFENGIWKIGAFNSNSTRGGEDYCNFFVYKKTEHDRPSLIPDINEYRTPYPEELVRALDHILELSKAHTLSQEAESEYDSWIELMKDGHYLRADLDFVLSLADKYLDFLYTYNPPDIDIDEAESLMREWQSKNI